MAQARDIYTFRQRSKGFENDATVWQALQERDDVAIVTPFRWPSRQQMQALGWRRQST